MLNFTNGSRAVVCVVLREVDSIDTRVEVLDTSSAESTLGGVGRRRRLYSEFWSGKMWNDVRGGSGRYQAEVRAYCRWLGGAG